MDAAYRPALRRDDMPDGLRQRVLAWVQREIDQEATDILTMTAYGSDWDGDTEEGFRSSFEVSISYMAGERHNVVYLKGEDLASLWKAVVY